MKFNYKILFIEFPLTDSNENDAYFHVPAVDRPRKSFIYLKTEKNYYPPPLPKNTPNLSSYKSRIMIFLNIKLKLCLP